VEEFDVRLPIVSQFPPVFVEAVIVPVSVPVAVFVMVNPSVPTGSPTVKAGANESGLTAIVAGACWTVTENWPVAVEVSPFESATANEIT
jgi:hypothetical protein